MKDLYHMTAGAIIGYGVMKGFNYGLQPDTASNLLNSSTVTAMVATAFISVIPNLDNSFGMGRGRGFIGSTLGTLLFKIYKVSDSRGALHSLWCLFLAPIFLYGLTGFRIKAVVYCTFFAILTHLIMDSFTPFGICWLPLPTWEYDTIDALNPLADLPGARNDKRKYISLAKISQTGFKATIFTLIVSALMSNIAFFVVRFFQMFWG